MDLGSQTVEVIGKEEADEWGDVRERGVLRCSVGEVGVEELVVPGAGGVGEELAGDVELEKEEIVQTGRLSTLEEKCGVLESLDEAMAGSGGVEEKDFVSATKGGEDPVSLVADEIAHGPGVQFHLAAGVLGQVLGQRGDGSLVLCAVVGVEDEDAHGLHALQADEQTAAERLQLLPARLGRETNAEWPSAAAATAAALGFGAEAAPEDEEDEESEQDEGETDEGETSEGPESGFVRDWRRRGGSAAGEIGFLEAADEFVFDGDGGRGGSVHFDVAPLGLSAAADDLGVVGRVGDFVGRAEAAFRPLHRLE